jgi:hypothetical protein
VSDFLLLRSCYEAGCLHCIIDCGPLQINRKKEMLEKSERLEGGFEKVFALSIWYEKDVKI